MGPDGSSSSSSNVGNSRTQNALGELDRYFSNPDGNDLELLTTLLEENANGFRSIVEKLLTKNPSEERGLEESAINQSHDAHGDAARLQSSLNEYPVYRIPRILQRPTIALPPVCVINGESLQQEQRSTHRSKGGSNGATVGESILLRKLSSFGGMHEATMSAIRSELKYPPAQLKLLERTLSSKWHQQQIDTAAERSSYQLYDAVLRDLEQQLRNNMYGSLNMVLNHMRSTRLSMGKLRDLHAVDSTTSLLGKRGRNVLDLEQERHFLNNSSELTDDGFRSVDSWDEIFCDYNENHDGFYREWMWSRRSFVFREALSAQRAEKKKNRKNDPILKHQYYEIIDDTLDDRSLLEKLIPPPVPTAIQHPACWGIGIRCLVERDNNTGLLYCCEGVKYSAFSSSRMESNKRTLKKQSPIFESLHPAACSRTTVLPVQSYSSASLHYNSSNSAPNHARAGLPTELNGRAKSIPNGCIHINGESIMNKNEMKRNRCTEDADDLNIFTEQVEEILKLEEANNTVVILKLYDHLAAAERTQKLTKKRKLLEELIAQASMKHLEISQRMPFYSVKPPKEHTHFSSPVADTSPLVSRTRTTQTSSLRIPGVDVHNSSSARYVTRGASAEDGESTFNQGISSIHFSSPASKLRREGGGIIHRKSMIGACAQHQLPQGWKLIPALFVGATIDVRIKGNWINCIIEKIRKDGSIIRHLKVRPLEGSAVDSIWVSAEDGEIALFGTHRSHGKINKSKFTSAVQMVEEEKSGVCNDSNPDNDQHQNVSADSLPEVVVPPPPISASVAEQQNSMDTLPSTPSHERRNVSAATLALQAIRIKTSKSSLPLAVLASCDRFHSNDVRKKSNSVMSIDFGSQRQYNRHQEITASYNLDPRRQYSVHNFSVQAQSGSLQPIPSSHPVRPNGFNSHVNSLENGNDTR